MKTDIEKRAFMLGEYIAETGATVRSAAKKFSVSKSTVHKDVSERLKEVDLELYLKAGAILMKNKEQRHIRGGMATKEKYRKIREKTG